MQAVAGMLHELRQGGSEEVRKPPGKGGTHLGRIGSTTARRNPIVLPDVGLAEGPEPGRRIGTAGRREPPAADRGTDQVHRLGCAQQEFAKNILVDRSQDQPFRPTRSGRNRHDLLGPESFLAQPAPGKRPGDHPQARRGGKRDGNLSHGPAWIVAPVMRSKAWESGKKRGSPAG